MAWESAHFPAMAWRMMQYIRLSGKSSLTFTRENWVSLGTPQPGDVMVLSASGEPGPPPVVAVTDSDGGTWTVAFGCAYRSLDGAGVVPETITVTFGEADGEIVLDGHIVRPQSKE